MNLSDKKILIAGLGKSGYYSALFLKDKCAGIFVTERKMSETAVKYADDLKKYGISVELGGHDFDKIAEYDLAVISPGIPPRADIVKFLLKNNIELIGETDLAYSFCPGEVIAVTGTNGKTSVTKYISFLLKKNGFDAVSCGNIGNPFVKELERITKDTKVVLEISSFQLYYSEILKPRVAVLLNLAPDHLDWHIDIDEYYRSKFKIFKNLDGNSWALINAKDEYCGGRIAEIKGNIRFFNRGTEKNYNREVAALVAGFYGIDYKTAVSQVNFLPKFEHRLEVCFSGGGRVYVNDSKSTSPHSIEWALNSFSDKVTLIAGGRNKGLDFSCLRPLIAEKVKLLILIGESACEIADMLRGCGVNIAMAESLKEAVLKGKASGGTVLFSPGCASFDMFSGYSERGRRFKEIVREVEENV